MIGEYLTRAMKKRNLTTTELSRASGLKVSTVSNIKNNNAMPSIPVLEKLATVLICSTDELLGRGHEADI